MLRLRLVIEDDEGKTTVVPLIRDEITIGRKEGNTIRLTERNVSRQHARLMRTGESSSPTVIVEDLDSYNGIRLNGDRITKKCTMRPGDLIQIGDYALALRADEPTSGGTLLDGKTAIGPPPLTAGALGDAATAVHQVDQALPEEKRGRLVVVSSNLAGETYFLNRREVIVGRTDENDVVVNHRSISRNHAKVIFRDNTFTIIDLASSNGVKVNSEPFGTASLVNGDIIELGHVKMRYVAPGDNYVFTPSDIEDVPYSGGSGGAKIFLAMLILAGVAVIAFFLVRKEDPKPIIKTPVAAESASMATPKTPPTKASPPLDIPAEVDVSSLIAEGTRYLKDEKWSDAANVFGRVLEAQPEHADAIVFKKKATQEASNLRTYNTLIQDMDQQRWGEAYFAIEDFPKDSVYLPRLAEKRAIIEAGYAGGQLAQGQKMVKEGDLKGAKKVQLALAEKEFASEQAAALSKAIQDTVVAAAQRVEMPQAPDVAVHLKKAKRPPSVKAPPVQKRPTPPKTPKEKPVGNYKSIMKDAMGFAIKGQRAEAISLLEKARRLKPGAKAPHQRLCALYPGISKRRKALKHCKIWLAKERNGAYKNVIRKRIERLESELN